jgi:hypothetical protein
MRALAGERYGRCGYIYQIALHRRIPARHAVCVLEPVRASAYLVAKPHSAYSYIVDIGRELVCLTSGPRFANVTPKSTASKNGAPAARIFFAASMSGSKSAERRSMNIYIFKSEANRDLRAFSGDQGGQNLPKQFRPWHAVGVVKPDSAPPNNLSRDVIEKSLANDGFQLWKLKNDKK